MNDSETTIASPDAGETRIFQYLWKFILAVITVILALSCATTGAPTVAVAPSVPPTELKPAVAHTPRIITAQDPIVAGLAVKKDRQWVANEGPDRKFEPQVGEVSFYHEPQKTASGGHFDPNTMTAAHKKLPFFTIVRCTRLDTGKSVIVMITDRGPHVDGRILDLSHAAGTKLGLVGEDGVARCRIEVLAYPLDDKA